MKKTLANYYLFLTLFFSFAMILSITTIYIQSQNDIFLHMTEEITEKIIENNKGDLKNSVEILESAINFKQSTSEQRLKETIQTRVNEAIKITEALILENEHKMNKTELKALIVQTLRTIRFNHGRGYYFIDTIKGDCVLFPARPSDEGQNIAHYQDINGKYVIKDFVEIATTMKEGFSEYFTLKPETGEKRFKKITFVKLFEKYNWVIGAGEYVYDVEEDIKKEIAEEIKTYRINNSKNYFTIFEVNNFEGGDDFATLIINPNLKDSFYGQKISDNIQDNDGVFYRKLALAQIREHGEGFVTYKYRKFQAEEIIPKLSYFKRINHWNWVITTGQDLSALHADIQINETIIKNKINQNIRYTLLAICVLLALVLSMIYLISQKIKRDMSHLGQLFRLAVQDKTEINEKQFVIEEFKELSSYANAMIHEIKFQHENLKNINQNLEVNVFEKTRELHNLNFSLETKNKELEENYLIDSLTKLPNRNMFTKDFSFMAFPQVILIDIDGFKHINDFYGTEVGDIVLVEFAEFICDFAQNNAMKTYRLSSDEFLLLYDKRYSEAFAQETIKHISALLFEKQFKIYENNLEFKISVTFGVAFGKNTILEKADIALNYAKKKKLSYAVYDEENMQMNTHKQNIYWRQKIQEAIASDSIVPYFQRIVDTRDNSTEKYECLMRLVDDKNVYSPYLFLDIAKETRLYDLLTHIMIKKSFEMFAHSKASFSLNMSLLDIENEKTVALLEETIIKYGNGDRLVLELLESEDMMESNKVLPFIEKMKALNVRFALDDFGSGYSNFTFVLKIAPHYLKIDGSLIKNILDDKNAFNVVQAIVAVAQKIDAEVIAEFVENEALVNVLTKNNVHLLQGYYFSKPSPTLSP